MSRKVPQPRNGENAEEAEARLKALRGRFSRVSRGLGRGGSRNGAGGDAPRSGFSFSAGEWLIAGGVVVFVVVLGGMALG